MASKSSKKAIWEGKIVGRAIVDSFVKLDPAPHDGQSGDVRGRDRQRDHHGAAGSAAAALSCSICRSRCGCGSPCCSPTSPRPWPKAAARRRPTRCARRARRPSPIALREDGQIEKIPSSKLRAGDMVVVVGRRVRSVDGEIIEGVASVDESAITGESAPVIREAGGDRSAVTGGTRVLSDEIKVKVTSNPGETFLDRMIALVEGAERQKTPNEIALNILLAGLTIIFLLAVVTSAAVRHLLGRAADGVRAGLAAGLPDSDDDRRLAFGDRHRRHGPPGAAQRAGDVGTRGRSRRRRGHAAARQDRNDHARQSAGSRNSFPLRASAKRKWPMRRSCLRWRTRRPRAARSWCWRRRSTACADGN